jgi:hypothetical protein
MDRCRRLREDINSQAKWKSGGGVYLYIALASFAAHTPGFDIK